MGKYVLDGLLGPGGVTETYLVHPEAKSGGQDDKADAPVELFALKLLRPDRVAEGRFTEVAARFVAAGRQLRDFHRPGFCRVVDLCHADALAYMVSEHVPGCDLGRLLETSQAEGKPGVHPLLVGLVGSEVARLLQVGHSAKPVFPHLGLSAQNVIVAASGEVTLVDAGVAASVRAITEQPPERWALVAPELRGVDVVLTPLPDRAAIAADLYSLGALMFLLLTGRAPSVPSSSSRSPVAVEEPEISGITGKLAAALRTLLSAEPEDRPADASVLVEWLAGDVVQVRERQRLIAQAVSATERGLRVSSIDLAAIASEPAPSTTKAPESQEVRPSTSRSAALDKPTHRLRTVALVFVGLVAVAWSGLGIWPGQPWQGTRSAAARLPRRQANAEMPNPVPPPSVETSAKRDDLPARPTVPSLLAQVAGHLIVETVPPGAMVWVDGVLEGKTFADIVVGEGSHRIVVIAPAHRMLREVVDTSHGAIIRRVLSRVPALLRGNGFVDVSCRTEGRYPVLVDGEETGSLCPATMLPTQSGRHTVGVFVPTAQRVLEVETTVEPGSRPASVSFSQ